MVDTLLLFSDFLWDLEDFDFSLAFTDFLLFDLELFRLFTLTLLLLLPRRWDLLDDFFSLFLLWDLFLVVDIISGFITRSVFMMPVYVLAKP